ncbi:MAG TPA: HAMP domain-containing sensor histidine kinase [Candidatus Aquilonibacter sp.]
MTLRTRLAWTYGIAIAIVVAIVAIVSLIAIDRTLRSSLDARLTTTASAIAALVDVRNGALVFDAEDRQQMLDALSPAMGGTIFTRDGRTFVSSTPLIPAAIAAAAQHGTLTVVPATVVARGAQLRTVCRSVARRGVAFGYVCVWASAAYIDDVDRDAILAIALAAVLAGGFVVVLSTTLARRALAPLQAFSDLATEIEAHDLSQRVQHGGDDELGRLGSAFDRMLDRLESAFARQRRFTADASHELRAPLAVIRAEADAALQQERAPQKYQEALHAIIAEVERIDALVDALLLAARADSARLHFEPVDLSAIASLIAERFAGAAAHRGVAIDVSGESCTVMADPSTLERAIAAIVHNAIDFAQQRVELRVDCNGTVASLTTRDDGPGFSREGLQHATQRFWRDARRERAGTGLGLAIAEAIVDAHGGALRLANQAVGGAEVTVTIPRSS